MAETVRINDTARPNVGDLKEALIAECRNEGENCLYTSASFLIWLRYLKVTRAVLWVAGGAASIASASHIFMGSSDFKVTVGLLALGGVLMPGIVRAAQLDKAIQDYSESAARFTNLRAEFRRLAEVWSKNSLTEFEAEARKSFKSMNEARKPSLTPPEICFWLARRKIERGHYKNELTATGSQRE